MSTVLAAGVGMLRLPFAVLVGIVRFLFRVHWALGVGVLLYLGLPAVAGVPFAVAVTIEPLSDEPLAGVLLILGAVWPLYVVFVAPLLGLVVRRTVLREREYLADAEAVLLTRHGEGLARALAKMSRAPLKMKAGVATVHLYVVDPLGEDAPVWDRVFPTHPPVRERIALLAEMGGGISPSVLRAAEEAGARFRSVERQSALADGGRQEAGSPAAEVATSADATGSEEAGRSPVAFRLTGAGATLYEKPDAGSTPLARLAGGTLITVSKTEGDFLGVITTDDSFGYVSRLAPMTEVDLDDPTA